MFIDCTPRERTMDKIYLNNAALTSLNKQCLAKNQPQELKKHRITKLTVLPPFNVPLFCFQAAPPASPAPASAMVTYGTIFTGNRSASGPRLRTPPASSPEWGQKKKKKTILINSLFWPWSKGRWRPLSRLTSADVCHSTWVPSILSGSLNRNALLQLLKRALETCLVAFKN